MVRIRGSWPSAVAVPPWTAITVRSAFLFVVLRISYLSIWQFFLAVSRQGHFGLCCYWIKRIFIIQNQKRKGPKTRSAPPTQISGANGKFLPKPLLFHLRHPNSKKISRVFCEILSPKNSFRKTESILKPHALPEYLEGRTPKEKHPSFSKRNFTPAKSEMQGVFFFRGCWRTRQCARLSPSVQFSFKPLRTRSVRNHYLTLFWK